MSLRRMPWISALTLTFALLVACVEPALAQEDLGPYYGKGIQTVQESKPWLQWLVGTLLIAACVLAAIKNPHRTHLD